MKFSPQCATCGEPATHRTRWYIAGGRDKLAEPKVYFCKSHAAVNPIFYLNTTERQVRYHKAFYDRGMRPPPIDKLRVLITPLHVDTRS